MGSCPCRPFVPRHCLSPRSVAAQHFAEPGGHRDDAFRFVLGADVIEAGQQAGPLGSQPGQPILIVGQPWHRGRRRWRLRGLSGARLVRDEVAGQASRMLVIVKEPLRRRYLVAAGDRLAEPVAGKASDEVVHAVPPPGRLGQQSFTVQGVEEGARLGHGAAG